MKTFLRYLLRFLIAIPAVVATAGLVAFLLCFQTKPAVPPGTLVAAGDLDRVKRVVFQHHPGQTGLRGLQSVTLDARDAALLLNYMAQRFGEGGARLRFRPGMAEVDLSLRLRWNPIAPWLNVSAEVVPAPGVPEVNRLQIGNLPVPPFVADLLVDYITERLASDARGRIINGALRNLDFDVDQVSVRFDGDVTTRIRQSLLSPEERARLRVYHERLTDALAGEPETITLATLLPPMFALARDRAGAAGNTGDGSGARSAGAGGVAKGAVAAGRIGAGPSGPIVAGGDIRTENRAALLVLTLYVNGREIEEIVPDAAQWSKPKMRTVKLGGRDDLAKHFIVSAAIAAEAGTMLSEVLGVYKEVDDSRGGSGFSFVDLGADVAGTRFGELASRSGERARELAGKVAAGVKDSDLMPNFGDLPESIPEAAFVRDYGGIGGAGYAKMLAGIEQRVGAVPLLR